MPRAQDHGSGRQEGSGGGPRGRWGPPEESAQVLNGGVPRTAEDLGTRVTSSPGSALR